MTDVVQSLRETLARGLVSLDVPRGETLVVAVSGGADSLALALLLASQCPIICLTVDHGLRSEAADEARYVARVMANHGVEHHILTWEDHKPSANVQAVARQARYGLMAKWCQGRGLRYLVTGHHRDDQAETLLLRLARGSGVYGLAAMAPKSRLSGYPEIKLLRPLLDVPKSQLIGALEAMGVAWVEDPSNADPSYDRVKVREFLRNPTLEGLSSARLAATAKRLRRTRDALEFYEQDWLTRATTVHDVGYIDINCAEFSSAPTEIVLRAMASLCRYVGGEVYVPRMEKIERLIEHLRAPDFAGATLYGAQFLPHGNGHVLVCREVSACAPNLPLAGAFEWDNRFDILAAGDLAGLEIGALADGGWRQALKLWPNIRENSLPHTIKLGLPAIFEADQLQAIPHLGYGDLKNISLTLSRKPLNWSKK